MKTYMRVQIGEVVTTIPTIGFNVESVQYKNLNFNVWVKPSDTFLYVEQSLKEELGLGWPDVHTAILAVLLRKYSGCHFRD